MSISWFARILVLFWVDTMDNKKNQLCGMLTSTTAYKPPEFASQNTIAAERHHKQLTLLRKNF